MIVEVDELGAALNAMKRGLKSFKKYVPSDLVNDLLTLGKEASLGTEKKTVTIMFSDIVGFTGISEKLSSEDLAPRDADSAPLFLSDKPAQLGRRVLHDSRSHGAHPIEP